MPYENLESQILHDDRIFVLENVPDTYEETLIKDYVEGNLEEDVEKVIILPYIHGRVLVILKHPLSDFASAAETLKMEKIESQEIVLSRTFRKQAILVTDIDFSMLEEEFLKHYLEFTFGDSENIVDKCVSWPSLNVAAVHFLNSHKEVVDKILATEDHIALPTENYHIKIQPFFANFHDHIEHVSTVSVSPAHGCGTKLNFIHKEHDQKANKDDLSDTETSTTSEDESSHTTEESITSSECESEKSHSSGSKTTQQEITKDDSDLEDVSDESFTWEQVNTGQTDHNSDERDSDESDSNTPVSASYRGRGKGLSLSKPVIQVNTAEADKDSDESDSNTPVIARYRGRGKGLSLSKPVKKVNTAECDKDSDESDNNTPVRARYRGKGRDLSLSKPVLQLSKSDDPEENNSDRVRDDQGKEFFQSRQKTLSSKGRGLFRVKSGQFKKQKKCSENELDDNDIRDHDDVQSIDANSDDSFFNIQQHSPSNTRGMRSRSRGMVSNPKVRGFRGRGKNIYHFKQISDQENTDRIFNADDFSNTTAVYTGHKVKVTLEPGEDNEYISQSRMGPKNQGSNYKNNYFYKKRGTQGRNYNHKGRGSFNKTNHDRKILPSDNYHRMDSINNTEVSNYNKQQEKLSQSNQGDKKIKEKNKNFIVDLNYEKPHYRSSSKSRNEKPCSELSADLRTNSHNNFSDQRKLSEEKKPECNEIQKLEMTPLQAKCLKSYMKTIDSCEVKYDSDQNVAVIRGSSQAVKKCQVDLMLKLREIKIDTITVTDEVRNVLSTESGKQYLSNLTSSEFQNAFLELDSHGVKITAVDNIAYNIAANAIREKLGHREIIKGKTDIPADKIKMLKLIEYKYLITIDWKSENAEFEIQGIKDHVLSARKDVESFLQEFGIFEKSFVVGKPWATYFYLCLTEQINGLLRHVKITSGTITEQQIDIRFQGSKEDTNQVAEELDKLKGEIKFYAMNLTNEFKQQHEFFLICKSFQSGILKEVVDKFKYQHKCLIDTSNLTSVNLTSKANKKSKLPKKSSPHVSKTIKPLTIQQENSAHKIIFDISTTCQLVIKPYGDIVREKSDILVSVLGTDLDLRKTRAGISFNHRFRSHWREVKASYEQSLNKSVVTVKGPKGISCLAVCHIILEPWNQVNSNANLISAIQEVFNQAIILGAKTVSFPALGCGKVFKFPSSDFAQSIIHAMRSMNIGKFLQKVVILAPEGSVFNELDQQASLFFKRLHLPHTAKNNASTSALSANSSSDTSEDSSDDSSDEDELTVDYSHGNKSQSTTDIVIMTQHGVNIQALIKQIKQEISEKCLHTEYFNQEILKYWPGHSRKKIIEEAKKLSVWVERSPHPKTKHVGFFLKGEKEAVNIMIKFIQEEFQDISSHLPKKRISSTKAPKRGTIDFMRYASESDELFPSYWSLNESKTFFKKMKSIFSRKQQERKLLVSVDKETKDAIINIVMKTFEPQLVGQGNDAVGLNYRAIQVVDVQRVENMELFEVYRDQRKRLFKRMVKMKQICHDIGKIPGSKGRVETSKYLSDAMRQELYYEVNEHYLFHGAKADTIDAIIHKGIDPKLASDEAMFGRGVYAAEKSTKSDQYTDSRNNRLPNGTKLKLILVRVLLGNVYLCDSKNKYVTSRGGRKLSRPPCMKCLADKCKCTDPQFDSVLGDGGWLFREFVVYETNHCYPEYVITYQRA